MNMKYSVSDPSPRKIIIIIQFKFIIVLNQQSESQLQKQHEEFTVYTSNSIKQNNKGIKIQSDKSRYKGQNI